MDTEHSAITEPVRRIEVFSGAGRRRSWSDADKARIVGEIATSGESICAVARRHGLSPQQLFGWRRKLKEAAAGCSPVDGLQFVPAVVEAAPSLARRDNATESEAEPNVGLIEVALEGVTVRVGRGADAKMVIAVLRALKAGM